MQEESASYERAADLLAAHLSANPINFDYTLEDIAGRLAAFRKDFGPEALQNLSDDILLESLFQTGDGENRSLCGQLEFNKAYKELGSIAGGSAFKFGLFRRKDDGVWFTGSAKAPKPLSDNEALQQGRDIRGRLVKACALIKSAALDCAAAYERLDDELQSVLGPYAAYAWVHKYLFMMFPDKLAGLHVSGVLRHFLYGLGIMPSAKYYGMNGQLTCVKKALVKKTAEWDSPRFEALCYSKFGKACRFIRLKLDSAGSALRKIEQWQHEGAAAAGWKQIGDLGRYFHDGALDKHMLTSALLENGFFSGSKNQASRRAGEMKTFYEAAQEEVFTLMNGTQPIAFVDALGAYYFDAAEENWPHKKKGVWHCPFGKDEKLPQKEGLDADCAELKAPENLLFLYQKYYWPQEQELPAALQSTERGAAQLRFNTGYEPADGSFERNRILFGAPGTGKSYKLNLDLKTLLKEGGGFERVTFFPDYSYANFVGAYKPVPCQDSEGRDAITYAYVPGPFMRIYVQALQSGRTDVPKPFVLIIEELNRANAAAVFGDIFQLLDRDGNGVSEYSIVASEDVRKYLAQELGGKIQDYTEIRIPDNMYVWATMNSADQGVFPLDTAFKRRWDFEYLSLDAGVNRESILVQKKFILGQKPDQCTASWNELRQAINDRLALYGMNEDKLLGPHFIAEKYLEDDEAFCRVFKNKVIMYLFEDAARQYRRSLFAGCAEGSRNRYSKICAEFDKKGVFIFCAEISDKFRGRQPAADEAAGS